MWISRQVLREYLATLTRPQAFDAVPSETVREQVRQFIQSFEVADDTAAVTDQLLKLLGDLKIGGKQVHDANIVATMLAYDVPCLLTHNVKDFERFAQVIRVERIETGPAY